MVERIGFIHYPGMRARAFLGILSELGIEVSVVVEMSAEIPNLDAIREESRVRGYDRSYFDTGLDLESFLRRSPSTRRIPTGASGINDAAISEALDADPETLWIFSGGGILKPHLFRDGRRILHVHPGRIPEFRGSTCFYYSLLSRNELAATCFVLEPDLDRGQILFETRFEHNLRLEADQRFFMDSILDPWMRSIALKGALLRPLPAPREPSHQAEDGNAFFVAHPFLRHLAIQRMNSRFRPDLPAGIRPVETRE